MTIAPVRRAAGILAATALAAIPVLTPPATAASTTIVVNEVNQHNQGPFVELRNLRGGTDFDISGWSLWLCSPNYGLLRLVTVPAGHVVPPNGHYLIGGHKNYSPSATPQPDLLWPGGREIHGFPSVRLTDGSGVVVDQVSGTDGNPCVERAKARPVLSNTSTDKFSLGRSAASDTDDNANDFRDVQRTPTASGRRTTPVLPPSPISELRHGSVQGETHKVEAVVTGIDDRDGSSYDALYPEDRGLFVQEEPDDQDADPNTSEGIFVAGVKEPSAYRPGDVVRVTGTVKPKFGLQVISYGVNGVPEKIGAAPEPEPVEIDQDRAKAEGPAYFRMLESMRVRLAQGTVNSGGTNKFGELFVTTGSEQRRFFRTDTRKDLLGIADDAGAGKPTNAYKDRRSSTRLELDLFDRVEDVVGPLGFSYENYKIYPQPGAMPRVEHHTPKRYPLRLAKQRKDEVRIASFNVENFFPVGIPIGGPGTQNTPQGVPTEEEYAEQRDEILAALDDVLGRPDVIAVQEVYANDAGSTPLQDLATRLSRDNETYTAYVAKSNDLRGIANGYLVKSTVAAANPRLLGAGESGCAGKLFDRPPFAIDLTLGGTAVTLLNNHFKSKGGQDEGIPCREAQANYVRSRVAEIEAAGGEAIVLGDLNSFEDETPLSILTNPAATSLTNLWSRAPEDERYSYAFQGRLQTLDHMVVTDGIAAAVTDEGFRYLHSDTDYADRTGHDGRKVIDGHGLSDHNPPVLTIPTSLEAPAAVPEAPFAALLPMAGLAVAGAAFALRRRGAPS